MAAEEAAALMAAEAVLTAAEAEAFMAAALTRARAFMAATLTEAVAFMTALRTTVLYRTDHSILGVGFVTMMTTSSIMITMTASSVMVLCSVAPGPGITTRTISEPTTIIPSRSSGR